MKKSKFKSSRWLLTGVCAVALITGCGDDKDDDSEGDASNAEKIYTVDASAGGRLEAANNPYVYIDLSSGEVVAGIDDDNADDASNSDTWHIALKRTSPVKLNGGVSGAGNVQGALAVASDLYDSNGDVVDTFANLTKDSEFDKFNDVTLTDAQALTYVEDTFGQAIDKNGWGVYNSTTHAYVMQNKWWIVKGGNSSYVKMRVTDYTTPNITIEYYYAADADTNYLTTNPETITTALTGDMGSACIDFDTDSILANCDIDNHESGEWDLLWEKDSSTYTRTLWTNGGVKGIGSGGTVGPKAYRTAAEDPNDGTDDADNFEYYAKGSFYDSGVVSIDVGTVEDSAGGIFADQEKGGKYGWGEYALAGGHNMWPNFRVWVLRTGEDGSYQYYKIQILSYYDETTGDSGFFSFRAEEITE